MKKYINKKLYDTEKATLIATCSDENSREALYRKRSGEYFLRTTMKSWAGGESIVPITWEDADDWAKDRLTPEEYKAAFGSPDMDTPGTTVLCISVTNYAAEKARQRASERAMSLSAYIDGLITRA